MGWGREYYAVITGKADEETKARFLQALREGDLELRALLDARLERAIAIERLLSGRANAPEAPIGGAADAQAATDDE